MVANTESAAVKISSDRMSAELIIYNISPLPSILELRSLLASRGVIFGVKDELLENALKAHGTWFKVAEGLPAAAPVHGHVQNHFDVSSQPRIAVSESGQANMKELGLLENVTVGFILATLIPPKYGIQGRNVCGEILYPEEPRTATLLSGKNVTVSTDGTELISDIDGRVVLDRDGRISVENIYVVNGDVGPATGNVNFLGTVVISGKVCSDYRVKAAQKILVSGSVEGAIIEAGQEITVKGGVAGGGHALLQSPGDIHLKFAQDSKIFCGGSLFVDHDLIRVTVVAAQSIQVKGAIIGGVVTAPTITAGRIGSETEVHTIVEFGISSRCKLICSNLEQEFITARDNLIKLRKKLQPLVAHYNARKIMTVEEKSTMESLENAVSELETKVLSLSASVRDAISNPSADVRGEVRVAGATYPGVILSTNRQVRAVTHEVKNLAATASEGKMSGGGSES